MRYNSHLDSPRSDSLSLVSKWGINGKPYNGHPYCCVAVFKATLEEEQRRCKWSFHGVTPYEKCYERALLNKGH